MPEENIYGFPYYFEICPLEILLQYEDIIDFEYVSWNVNLNMYLLRKYQSQLDWNVISIWATLDIILEFEDLINYNRLSFNKNITDDILQLYFTNGTQIDWYAISEYSPLEILQQYPDKIIYSMISRYQTLDVLEYFIDDLDFEIVIDNPNLTEEFVEKHQDRFEIDDE